MRARPLGVLSHHLRPATALLLFLVGVMMPRVPAASAAPEPRAVGPRVIEVSLAEFGGEGALWLDYDPAELTAPLSAAALDALSGEARGVRMILAEVGVDRLVGTAGGPTEALGMAFVVRNRLDEAIANPRGVRGYRPYPGCGDAGSVERCLNAGQFLGLGSARARDPGRDARPERLASAVDLALAAWRLAWSGRVPDPTGGATAWVHRCGGTAYGAPTTACDEPEERARGAVPGGPLVFKAPDRIGKNGAYTLRVRLEVPLRDRAREAPLPVQAQHPAPRR